MATLISGVNSWLTLNGVPLRFQEGDEHLDAQAFEYKINIIEITRQAPYPLEIFIDQKPLETRVPGYWQWKPLTYAGLYAIRISAPGYPDQHTQVRVSPQYFTQRIYRKMQDDLSVIATDLLFRLHSPTSEYVESIRRFQETSLLQEYKKVRRIVRELQPVLEHIRRNPHRTLANRQEERLWHEIGSINGEQQVAGGEYIQFQRRTGSHVRSLSVPMVWQVQQAYPSYDTHENRLLKQFLRQHLIIKLTAIENGALGEIQRCKSDISYKRRHGFDGIQDKQEEIDGLQRVIKDCQRMKQYCQHWSREKFLKGTGETFATGKATQILLKHPHYGRFYQLYLQFQQQLRLSLDTKQYLASLNARKVLDLYEMWSIFFLTRMVIDLLAHSGYTMSSSTLFYEIDRNYFQFDVRKNVASILLEKQDMQVKIIYEPVYPNHTITRQAAIVTTIGRSLPQSPDMAIEIYQGNVLHKVIIFDAKYKCDPWYYPETQDIDKMYRYKDNIKYNQYNHRQRIFQAREIVSAAYILYPGNKIFIEADGAIGGLPLRPGMSEMRIKEVREQLIKICSAARLL